MARYSRQTVFGKIGTGGQEKLLASRVAVVGVGALGTVIANNLCRAGVGYLRLIDRDYVETSNLQRQTLFDEEDARRQTPKAVAACGHLARVNSGVSLEPVVADVNSSSVERLCAGVDLILDGSDNLELRHLLNEYCVKAGVPWIYGAALRSGGATMNIIPGKTPCFRCAFPVMTPPGATCASAGVINMVTGLIACVESAEALKYLCGSPDLREGLFMVDLWHNTAEYLRPERNPDCPVCVCGDYELLGKVSGMSAVPLCGRDAVQINPASPGGVDFEALASKLGNAGTVEHTRFMLKFDDGRTAFLLFPDGRAIVQGTGDVSVAKSVYAEYVGM